MATKNKTTTSHDEIKKWAEERGGKPAKVKSAQDEHDTSVLGIDFEDKDDLEDVSWEVFFDEFDKRELAFTYQDRTMKGDVSRFFKFVKRQNS